MTLAQAAIVATFSLGTADITSRVKGLNYKHETLSIYTKTLQTTHAVQTVSILLLTHKSVLQGERAVGEHAFKSHEVEDLVDRVVCSYNTNISETHRK